MSAVSQLGIKSCKNVFPDFSGVPRPGVEIHGNTSGVAHLTPFFTIGTKLGAYISLVIRIVGNSRNDLPICVRSLNIVILIHLE